MNLTLRTYFNSGGDRHAGLFADLAPDGGFQNAVGAVANLDLAAGEGQNPRGLRHTVASDDHQVASVSAHRALRVHDKPRSPLSTHVVTYPLLMGSSVTGNVLPAADADEGCPTAVG